MQPWQKLVRMVSCWMSGELLLLLSLEILLLLQCAGCCGDSQVDKHAGCEGICCRCRWGICERHGPKQYDFKAYIELFKKAKKSGLKVQAVMSFHAGGGNVGDGSCDIPLPPWVLKVLADFC